MRLHLCFGVLTLSLLLTGCKPGAPTSRPSGASYDPKEDPLVNPPTLFEPRPEDDAKVARDETLYVHLSGSPSSLNPLFASAAVEFTVLESLFTGPFTFDKDLQWAVNHEMVESFEESEDHRSFTVRLKPGFKWHDGTPFTAHDIVYSWQQILDPRVPCPAQKPGTEEVKECVALDDLTVRYVQDKPLATSKWNIMFSIIPKHLFEKDKEQNPDLKSGDYYSRLGRQPVGNGPYRVVEWRENDQIVVERWEDYPGRKPDFKRIVFKIVPDPNVALLSFEKEMIDAIESISAEQFARETNTPTFERVGYKVWGTEWAFGYIGWNMDGSNPFFNDKRVRYAMTHALNLPLVIEKVYYNLATPCLGIYHPNSWMFNPEVKGLEYNPKRSAELLDEAGWKVSPEDGWRYKVIDGKPVKFEFTMLIPQGSPTGPRIASILQEDLKRLGVLMKTQTLEWAAFQQKVQKHEFQASTAGWGTGTDPDTGWNLWHSTEYEKGRNYVGYSNPRVDELFVQGRHEFDFDKRRKIYQEIHKIIYEDQPYTWIANRPILAAVNKRLRGLQLSPRGLTGFDPSYLGWWVPAGQAKHVAAMP